MSLRNRRMLFVRESPNEFYGDKMSPPTAEKNAETAGQFMAVKSQSTAMILAARLDVASVLVVFGGLQILTGLLYRMPMPVQPLKAMAALVIAQKADAATLHGGGLAIGVLVLVLTMTGMLSWLARAIPPAVVRGVQFGLGLQAAILSDQRDGAAGRWHSPPLSSCSRCGETGAGPPHLS
jgi:hypothetical protein